MRTSFDRSTMAPLPCSHQLRTAAVRVGTSKAQSGLAKIIEIISTVPPPPIERRGGNSEAARAGVLGFGIDLNLRLGPPPEIGGGGGGSSGNEDEDEEEEEEEDEGPTAQSVVVADVVAEPVESGEESTVEKGSGRAPRVLEESSAISPAVRSSEGECDSEEESRKEVAEGTKESSGITTAPSKKTDDGDEDEEAADAEEEEERPSKRRAAEVAQGSSKRRGAGWLPFDLYVDSAPIVRSKRGRNQALPSRYRDSVLDP